MERYGADKAWLVWTSARQALVGIEANQITRQQTPTLFVVLGHTPSSEPEFQRPFGLGAVPEAETYEPHILGTFNDTNPVVAVQWADAIDYIEVLQLQNTDLFPVVTFKLERDGSEDRVHSVGFLQITQDERQGGVPGKLSFIQTDSEVETTNIVMENALWACRIELVKPATGNEILRVRRSQRDYPTAEKQITITSSCTRSRQAQTDPGQASFIRTLKSGSVASMQLEFDPSETAHDLSTVLVFHLPRVAQAYKYWKNKHDFPSRRMGLDLDKSVRDFLQAGLERLMGGNARTDPDVKAAFDATRQAIGTHQERGARDVKPLTELTDTNGYIVYHNDVRIMDVAYLSAGDLVVIADTGSSEFLADGNSVSVAVFEAKSRGFEQVSGYSDLASPALAPLKSAIANANAGGTADRAAGIPEPLGSWIRSNEAPFNIDDIALPSFVAASLQDIRPSSTSDADLPWDSFQENAAAYSLARQLSPDADLNLISQQHSDSSSIGRAFQALNCAHDGGYNYEDTETELAALAFLWHISTGTLQNAFRTYVAVQAKIDVRTPAAASDFASVLAKLGRVCDQAQEINLPEAHVEAWARPILHGQVGTIENVPDALREIEGAIALSKFDSGAALDPGTTSTDQIDKTRIIEDVEAHLVTLNENVGVAVTAADLQQFNEYFDRFRQTSVTNLVRFVRTLERRFPDILQPRLAEDLRGIMDSLNASATYIDALEPGLQRRPSLMQSAISPWVSDLNEREGYQNATNTQKQRLKALEEAKNAQDAFLTCQNTLQLARTNDIEIPPRLVRSLRIWPQDMVQTVADFTQFRDQVSNGGVRDKGESI